ncbi:ABC transporter permease [Treponema sp. OMZ 787]|nr:ABC transporter permease [Treponema sp. OMZ 787]UTC63045.1 ABC transporter permease [Treponema sp. OMZ 787]
MFQISVNEDIRYYGLLKTIGVTSRQLRKIVGLQALVLSCIGIPIGLFAGYVLGAFLVPMIISQGNLSYKAMTISFSPFIFLSATVFSLFTVFFSCIRPAKIAGKVSPVEAAGYYRGDVLKKKSRKTRGSKIYRMAFANIGRNKAKTLFILLSLSFSVLLFYTVFTLVKGMDSEKYLNREICADFIVGSSSYFRFQPNDRNSLDQSLIEYIKKNTEQSIQGCSYVMSDSLLSDCRIDKDCHIIIQGLDTDLFSKLTVVEGDLFSLEQGRENMIAIVAYQDDYGNIVGEYPKIGDVVTVNYKNTNSEHTVMYKIAAIVKMPYSMGTRFKIRNSYKAVLHADVLRKDSGSELQPLFYLFDVFDKDSELKTEAFLNWLSKNVHSDILYESKTLARKKFNEFKSVFFILGNCLCFVVGLIGVLNFFNGLMTSILSRRKELAVLQAVGMTGRQLKRLLIYESLYMCTGIFIFSSCFILCVAPIFGNLMQKIFWFFTYKFSPAPLYILIPIFGIMGVILPCIIYSYIRKKTIVERLRDI